MSFTIITQQLMEFYRQVNIKVTCFSPINVRGAVLKFKD